MKLSKVTVRETKEEKEVRITSEIKEGLIKEVVEKWQILLDTVAKVAKVPSGLIMRLQEETIEVFLKSETEGNPYEAGEEAKLIYGLYCETVIGTQQKLMVPDATKSDVWKDNNPDVDIDMISYLGFPVNWPDGEVFGTVCVLDNKENSYNETLVDFLTQIRLHLEDDLKILMLNYDLEIKNNELEHLNNTKSKYLSLISHDVRGTVGTMDVLLKLLLDNYERYDKDSILPMLHALSKNANSSYLILENILSWSKNDLLDLSAHKEDVNLISILNKVLQFFEQEILLKEMTIVKEYISDSVMTQLDSEMMSVIIRNILSNAIKYTEYKGRINIRVYTKSNKHVLEIEDTGIGMSKESIDKLFSYDNKHKQGGTSGESSSGLGLLLVKEFIDKNNITVELESVLGKGTIFKLFI